MTKKTKVLRLTQEETSIITAIRQTGVDSFKKDVEQALTSQTLPSFRLLKSYIENTTKAVKALKDLQEEGCISERDVDKILLAHSTRQSIVLTGRESTGKKTLLQAIIALCNPSERLCVVETSKELNERKTEILKVEDNKIHTTPTAMHTEDLLLAAMDSEISRAVMTDISRPEDMKLLFNFLKYEVPVIFSLKQGEDVATALVEHVQTLRPSLTRIVRETTFLTILCKHEGDQFKAEVYEF